MPTLERNSAQPIKCSGPKKSITLPLQFQPEIGVNFTKTSTSVDCRFLIEDPQGTPFCSAYRQLFPELVNTKLDEINMSHWNDNKKDSNKRIALLTSEIKELVKDGSAPNVPCKYFSRDGLV